MTSEIFPNKPTETKAVQNINEKVSLTRSDFIKFYREKVNYI